MYDVPDFSALLAPHRLTMRPTYSTGSYRDNSEYLLHPTRTGLINSVFRVIRRTDAGTGSVYVVIRCKAAGWQYLADDGWVGGIAPGDPRASMDFCVQRAESTFPDMESAILAGIGRMHDGAAHPYRSTMWQVRDFDGKPVGRVVS